MDYILNFYLSRYYYHNCRVEARSYIERALVLLDDNEVK